MAEVESLRGALDLSMRRTVALALPGVLLIWCFLTPRTSRSLQVFENAVRTSVDGKALFLPPLEVTSSQLRVSSVPPEKVLNATGPIITEPAFDWQAMLHWLAETDDFRGPVPNTADNFFYHEGGRVGVSRSWARFANRDSMAISATRRERAYFGNIHGHTQSSDGQGTVADAFHLGRDFARMDFMAVTDHAEAWRLPRSGEDPWIEVQRVAASYTTPNFLGVSGFEYSSVIWGHFTILGTKSFHDSVSDFSLWDLYGWLNHPAQDSAIVFFNHPGFHGYRRPFEFLHFEYVPALRDKIVGMEILHRDKSIDYMRGFTGTGPYLDEALAKGWRLGAVAGQDNHRASWGVQDSVRMAVLMPALTFDSLAQAFRQRRFYATQNPGLQLEVEVRDRRGVWHGMGSRLSSADLPNHPIEARVVMADPSGAFGMKRIEIVSGGRVVARWENPQTVKPRVVFEDVWPSEAEKQKSRRPAPGPDGKVSWRDVDVTTLIGYKSKFRFEPQGYEARFELLPPQSSEELYFYVRIYQGEDEDIFTQSSPIWLGGTP